MCIFFFLNLAIIYTSILLMLLVFCCLLQHMDPNCDEYFFFFIFPLFPHYVLWTVSSCRNRRLRLVWFLRCLKTTWDWYGIISYVVNIFLTWNSKKGSGKIKKKGYLLEKGSLNIFYMFMVYLLTSYCNFKEMGIDSGL